MKAKSMIIQQENFDVFDDTLYGRDDQVLKFFEKRNANLDSAKLYQALGTVSGLASVISNWPQGKKLIAELTKEGTAKIASGEWKFLASKQVKGNLSSSIVSSVDGHFVQNVTLKPETLKINSGAALAQLGMQVALQELIQEVIDQLQTMNSRLVTIERGQRNDRIAMYYSAKEHCLQALFAKDKSIQKQLFFTAASKANDAMCMLMETCLTDIEEMRCSINNDSTSKREKCCEEKSKNIFEALTYINNALRLSFNAYKAIDEEEAAYVCLKSYQRFLKDSLMKMVNYKEYSGDYISSSKVQYQQVRFMLHSYGTLGDKQSNSNIDYFLDMPPVIIGSI